MTSSGMTTIKTEQYLEQYRSVSGRQVDPGKEVFSYGYQIPDGEVFQCVALSLEDCRAKRDQWLADKAAHEGKE